MKKIIIIAVVMAMTMASISWAEPPATGPRITYGGYSQRDAEGKVNADTIICVFNPNNTAVTGIKIAVYDAEGTLKADQKFCKGQHLSECILTDSISAKGWVWQTLGMLLPFQYNYTKYTFVIYWPWQFWRPYRGLPVEIKQVIYTAPYYPWYFWWAPYIRTWTETCIGWCSIYIR